MFQVMKVEIYLSILSFLAKLIFMEKIIFNDQILLRVSIKEEELIKKALMFLVRQTDNDEAKEFLMRCELLAPLGASSSQGKCLFFLGNSF